MKYDNGNVKPYTKFPAHTCKKQQVSLEFSDNGTGGVKSYYIWLWKLQE